MSKLIKLHCQNLIFDPKLSEERLKKAAFIFGEKVLINLFCLCLYLLGVKRSSIGECLSLSVNTVRAKMRTFLTDGITSLSDRRKGKNKHHSELEYKAKNDRKKIILKQKQETITIKIGEMAISIPARNKLQVRTIIITLVENKIITKTKAAEILNFSSAHVGYLCKVLKDKDVHCFVDQRKGTQQDRKFTPTVKSELIKIFAVNNLIGKKTSGKEIGEELETIFKSTFSERSVRYHMQKLGLNNIKSSLQEKYEAKKKA